MENLFQLGVSCHDMFYLEVKNPSPQVREYLRGVVLNQWSDSDYYKVRKAAGAFLQCDYADYILIEFWKDNGAESFLEFVNENFRKKYPEID